MTTHWDSLTRATRVSHAHRGDLNTLHKQELAKWHSRTLVQKEASILSHEHRKASFAKRLQSAREAPFTNSCRLGLPRMCTVLLSL